MAKKKAVGRAKPKTLSRRIPGMKAEHVAKGHGKHRKTGCPLSALLMLAGLGGLWWAVAAVVQ